MTMPDPIRDSHRPMEMRPAPIKLPLPAGSSHEPNQVIRARKDASLTRQVIDQVIERALEHPPRDINKLIASVNAFLLTNLEPAMELARELRERAGTDTGAAERRDVLLPDRAERAGFVLEPGE